MDVLVLVIVVMAASVVVVGLGDRWRLPWPALMVVLGAAAAFVPGISPLAVDPHLILPLFLPPLLFATAQRTSWSQFRSRWRSVLGLAVVLTAVTVVVVAVAARLLVPGLALTAAIALGAAVAPPDPVAVEAVAGPLGIPRRLVSVLQSEGLFNDAVALVVFTTAVAALDDGSHLGAGVLLGFAYGVVAAVVLGLVGAWLAALARARLTEVAGRNALTLVLPFAVYLGAEELHASGVIAVVVTALQLGRTQGADDGEDRLSGAAFWDVVELLATGIAFGLVGTELRGVVATAGSALPGMLLDGLVVAVVVVALRGVWLFVSLAVVRRSSDASAAPRTAAEAVVLTWCGMRGLATLALALALPTTLADGSSFAARTECIVVASTVLVLTLLVPAFTLPVLLRVLGVREDAAAERAAERALVRRARRAAADALRDPQHLAGAEPDVVDEAQVAINRLEALLPQGEDDEGYRQRVADLRHRREVAGRLQAVALDAARAEVLRARREPGTDPHAADRVLRRLDLRTAPLP